MRWSLQRAGKGRVASHWSVTAGHCSLAGSKVILVAGQSLLLGLLQRSSQGPRVSGRLHVPIVGPTGRTDRLSDWSVRRSYRVNASSDRRTDGRRIKHA